VGSTCRAITSDESQGGEKIESSCSLSVFLRQGDNCALLGRGRLPNRRLQFEGSKDGGWAYTYFGTRESEMEIPVQDLDNELVQRIEEISSLM